MTEPADATEEANDRADSQGFLHRYIYKPFLKEKEAMWTAIFTGVLVFFTYQLVRVTDKVDDTTRATQRAFVSFQSLNHSIKILSPTDKTQWIMEEMIALWKNSGTTPATRGGFRH